MSGPKKSFHAYTRWKIATAITTGHDCGSRTDQRIRKGPAPSIAAASSRSVGIVMKYWRMRNTSYALAKNAGTRSGSHVPTHPSFWNTVYVGMIVTAGGRKIVAMRRVNSRLRPGNRKRANPYATSVHESRVPMVEITAIAAVLNSSRG